MLEPEFANDIAAVNSIDGLNSIFNVIGLTTNMRFAAVARVTDERWITCGAMDNLGFGLTPGDELDVKTTLCHEVCGARQPIIIENTRSDPDFTDHPCPRQYGFTSYFSEPVYLPNGELFGTLCALDPEPTELKTAKITTLFKQFAELIGFHILRYRQLIESRESLAREQEIADFREKYVAMLAHDLRSPLNSITLNADLLREELTEPENRATVDRIFNSAGRMTELIEHVTDLAVSRFTQRIPLIRKYSELLDRVLRQILEEVSDTHPETVFLDEIQFFGGFESDVNRIGQLYSNLLNNAVAHGDRSTPITTIASVEDQEFKLSVSNGGKRIPPDLLGNIFQPFVRYHKTSQGHSLGLGLFIAGQIADAHNGSLTVTSDDQQTCFTFRMPVKRRSATATTL